MLIVEQAIKAVLPVSEISEIHTSCLLIRYRMACEVGIYAGYERTADALQDSQNAFNQALKIAREKVVCGKTTIVGFRYATHVRGLSAYGIFQRYEDLTDWNFFGRVRDVICIPGRKPEFPDCDLVLEAASGEKCPLPNRAKVFDIRSGTQIYPPPR